MTTTMPSTATYLADNVRNCLGYGQMLLAGIPADQFSHMPHPNMNHPAFCVGHLSIYPNQTLELLGVPEHRVEIPPSYSELFEMDVKCVEQDGRYPEKDELVGYYTAAYEAAIAGLGAVDESVFARETDFEGRFKQMCPTVGSTMAFMLLAHHMVHLGQISAWRRAIGMGSAM